MKHLIWSMLALIMLSVACENGDNNLPSKPDENSCYKGLLTVDQNDGTIFTKEDVEVDYEIASDGTLNFVMYKVKFAQAMPITLDMVVEGVTCVGDAGSYLLSGDGLVPYAMGGPFEKYTITELAGVVTPNTMTLSFMCGEYPVTYEGERAIYF